MKLMFIGAAHEVTGSCHHLEACGLKILIDCGMEQGSNKYENAELPSATGTLTMCLSLIPTLTMWGFCLLFLREAFPDRLWRPEPPATSAILC